jgi:Fur family ferric uptake transcriptional regulator
VAPELLKGGENSQARRGHPQAPLAEATLNATQPVRHERERSERSGYVQENEIRALTDAGLVRRIEPAGSPARYETRVGDNHHHLVCRACGATHDVDCIRGTKPCLAPAQSGGFIVDEAEVIFWGRCPACQTRTEAAG